jgi:hypothetical protein
MQGIQFSGIRNLIYKRLHDSFDGGSAHHKAFTYTGQIERVTIEAKL